VTTLLFYSVSDNYKIAPVSNLSKQIFVPVYNV